MSKDQYWDDFVTSKPEFNLLKVGEHLLRVIRVEKLNSFQQYNGKPKENLPDYANACPQMAVTVVTAEEGKSGGMTFRLNRVGFVKFDELSDKGKKEHEEIDGWACYKDEDGDIVRRIAPERTKSCENIMNQFASALQIPEGTKFSEGIEGAIENQIVFRGTVVNEPYEGRDQLRLTRFRAVTVEVPAEADFED